MKIAFATLGCKTNQYETSLMCEDLRDGNDIIPFDQEADVYIINTCTVTHKADYQSRQLIRRAINNRKDAKVIVTGCYAERQIEELKALGAHAVIGNKGKNHISEYFNNIFDGKTDSVCHTDNNTIRCKATFNTVRTRAFLKIQDGCNYSCSYCIVPFVRGRSRSASLKNVFEEVKALIDKGYKEVVLTGIQLGAYGRDLNPKTDIVEVLKELLKIEGQFRLRLSSIEPQDVTTDLIELIKYNPKICRHLHLPLQSGDDEILKIMGRNYTSSYYKELILTLISEIPEIGLGTDIIIGFPNEKESNFQNTYNLLNNFPFSYIHIFSFSERPGTPIYGIKNNISFEKIKERSRILKLLSEKKNISFKERHIGRQLNVIVEDKIVSSGYLSGLSDNYIRLHIKTLRNFVGKVIKLRVKGFEDGLLIGERIINREI
ncbi:MAG: tRNA (N(6)-L-threonylcarbamoyladenosine(37)-C(2))-methylthiotransferase MtaB [Nitrospirae bacterium]|nr:tRNA (N(6)-L-threonylcarbamoyladenosine(37)-C(2))-methylthiotransferase MtaB [Nitrospirota bacterium]